ncbi:endonuclease/exonuclease/phosphatase family protein [Sphingobacterium haloxyli]|uniref:Endonuclease n=1 Tax=Sphingobacterium haloxyli TaxID=2100533 RepID=A0A2S9IVM0_9SPHI|nr:endonuclease/exonuclease/phosphatase family protein [Sphingobacterium haloxyli]PRD44574.1 endonuclease [Sphingobacterium haloxyli]
MIIDRVWHKMKHWRKVLSVSFVPIFFGFYLTKITDFPTSSSSYTEVRSGELEEIDEGELSLLTYNVAGLPDFLSSATSSRARSIKEISGKINRFDVVNVQEDFHYHQILYGNTNKHRYRTAHKTAVPYGDGLNTLSRYPLRKTERISWQHCNGSDCLAAKGFSFTQIEIAKGVSIDVYNVHATAHDNGSAAAARKKNLLQLAEYINTHSVGNAIIVMGDFNAHFSAAWDNMGRFTQQTGLQDVWTTLMKNGECPVARTSFIPKEKLALTDSCESIDKIFFRNSAYLEFTPSRYKVEKQHFSTDDGIALSDHYAISSILKWRKK